MHQDYESGAGPHVAGLYRYPVKGFSAEPLVRVTLTPGQTFPNDRRFAIENGAGRLIRPRRDTCPRATSSC